MNRVITIVLAVYVALIACYPCTDDETGSEDIHVAAVYSTDHSDMESGFDLCSPLCICSCCSAHVRLSTLASFEAAVVAHNSKFVSHYIGSPDLNVGHVIWQPPRA